MAGTAIYQVLPLHTYQRRLASPELGASLRDTHLYVVSRRPRTTVALEGAAFGLQRLTTTTHAGQANAQLRHSTDEVSAPVVLRGGAYWMGSYRGQQVHGEAWHLAALISGRAEAVSRHEVLYVGRAHGSNGSRNVEVRTRSHSTIQRIYEDHQTSDWDIFITPLIVDRHYLSNDDHISDIGGGIEGGIWDSIRDGDRAAIAKTTVYTVEHLLIAYFKPIYNQNLLQWNFAKHLEPLRDAGVRLLTIQLQTLHELTAFFTSARAVARTHNVVAEIPGSMNGTGFGIGKWSDLKIHPHLLPAILASSARTISKMAANAPGALTIFGETGPRLNPDFSGWS